MVKYSGPYPRLSKSERISSYIERAGGVKEEADLTGAILYRKKTQYFRENVTSKVASLTDSVGSIVLDSVKTTIAEVANEPVSIDLYRALKYKNSKYDIVLQEGDRVPADALILDSWRKRIFVTYANGKSRRTKNLFFMHFYPKVKEGSTVTVPSRPEGAEITDTLLQVVVSAIPVALAAYLVNLLR